MSDESTSRSVVSPGINRRTVMKGAAWSVPVIMVASAAPAFAVSPGDVTFVPGAACKHPGNSQNPFNQDYHFVLLIRNTTGADVTVTITAVWIGTSEGAATSRTFSVGEAVAPVNNAPKDILVPSAAGSTGLQYTIHGGGDNSAQSYIRIEFTYGGEPGTLIATALTTPPCDYPPISGPPNIYP